MLLAIGRVLIGQDVEVGFHGVSKLLPEFCGWFPECCQATARLLWLVSRVLLGCYQASLCSVMLWLVSCVFLSY